MTCLLVRRFHSNSQGKHVICTATISNAICTSAVGNTAIEEMPKNELHFCQTIFYFVCFPSNRVSTCPIHAFWYVVFIYLPEGIAYKGEGLNLTIFCSRTNGITSPMFNTALISDG